MQLSEEIQFLSEGFPFLGLGLGLSFHVRHFACLSFEMSIIIIIIIIIIISTPCRFSILAKASNFSQEVERPQISSDLQDPSKYLSWADLNTTMVWMCCIYILPAETLSTHDEPTIL